MNTQIPEWVKPAVWGAIAGSVVLAIIAFSAGWVVTSGTAQYIAKQQEEKAVIAALTPICVAQFKSQAKQVQTTQLVTLEGERSYQRGDYVEEHGWATMPGGDEPNDEVADACATELMKIAEK